jgi:DNA-directed RNA polymerase subunit RPC12/RpoP
VQKINVNTEKAITDARGICQKNGFYLTVENCYYKKNDIYNYSLDGATETETADFASGKIAAALNGTRTGSAAVWGQKLTGDNADAYPVFSSDYVYSGYKHGESTVTYTNDGTLKLHSDAASEENNNHDDSLDEVTVRIVGDDCHAYTCSVCGEEIEKSHDFGDGQYKATSDGSIHYIQCQDCGYRRVHSADMVYTQNSKYHVGACEHEGCNYTVDKEAHEFTRFFKGDAEKHIAVCEECGFVTAKEHNFVNGVCTDCGYEKVLEDAIKVSKVYPTVSSGKSRVAVVISRDIPGKYTIVENGIIYDKTGYVTEENAEATLVYKGANVITGKNALENLNKADFLAKIANTDDSEVYVRGYVVVEDPYGNKITAYSEVVHANYFDLAKSEIVENSSIEIIKKYATVSSGKNRFAVLVARDVPGKYTVVENGIIYDKTGYVTEANAEEKLVYKGSGVITGKNVLENKNKYNFLAKIANTNGEEVFVRGYMVVKDAYGNQAVVYSNVVHGSYDALVAETNG